jgi:hypothetical protein
VIQRNGADQTREVRSALLFFSRDVPMIKSVMFARLCLAALAVLSGSLAAQAQQFSADIVMRRGTAATPAGRLFVLDGKVRIETLEFADGFFLVDTAKPSAYFVRPAARIYMDARQSSKLTRLLVPVDPDEPCRQWQAMARLAGLVGQGDWRCERTGEQEIDGRHADVFHAVTGSEELLGWIDRARKFPLQIKMEDGAIIALEQIKEEPQAAARFEPPSGFRKFSPEALIERIKQSDVWVAGDKDKARP